MSTILLNGREHPLAAPSSVADLLVMLGLAGKPVVVEVDGRALLATEHDGTVVGPGARVEIVTLAAGG